MDLKIIKLSKISQSEKEKSLLSHLYVESNEQSKLMNKIETEEWTRGKD